MGLLDVLCEATYSVLFFVIPATQKRLREKIPVGRRGWLYNRLVDIAFFLGALFVWIGGVVLFSGLVIGVAVGIAKVYLLLAG